MAVVATAATLVVARAAALDAAAHTCALAFVVVGAAAVRPFVVFIAAADSVLVAAADSVLVAAACSVLVAAHAGVSYNSFAIAFAAACSVLLAAHVTATVVHYSSAAAVVVAVAAAAVVVVAAAAVVVAHVVDDVVAVHVIVLLRDDHRVFVCVEIDNLDGAAFDSHAFARTSCILIGVHFVLWMSHQVGLQIALFGRSASRNLSLTVCVPQDHTFLQLRIHRLRHTCLLSFSRICTR